MKQLLFFVALVTAFMFQSRAQQINPSDISKFTPSNKPWIVSGKRPTNGKSAVQDSSFNWREFTSVAEANSIVPSSQRFHDIVFVKSGGEVNMYWWKNGNADSNLVQIAGAPSFSDTASASDVAALMNINGWGHSMTYGTGSTTTIDHPGGVSYGDWLQDLIPFRFFNRGIPGQTSAQIKDRVLATSADTLKFSAIIWAADNDGPTNGQTMANINQIIAALGHDRYVVIGLIGQTSKPYQIGNPAGFNAAVLSRNAEMAAAYGEHFLNFRNVLIANRTSSAQDSADYVHGVIPTSFLANPSAGDSTHLNALANVLLARTIAGSYSYWFYPKTSNKYITTSRFKTLLNTTALSMRPLHVFVNGADPVASHYVNGDGYQSPFGLSVRGGARYLNSNANQGQGGIDIKERFGNLGGYATEEISGTNPTFWPSGAGVQFYNHARLIHIGSPVETEGGLTVGTTINAGSLSTTGPVYAQGGFYTHYPADGIIDVSNASTGIIPPFMSTVQQNSWRSSESGNPFGDGYPKLGEFAFNYETGHLAIGTVRDGYAGNYGVRQWRQIPWSSDIPAPQVFAGGRILALLALELLVLRL